MTYVVIYEKTSNRYNWNVRDTVLWCLKQFGPIGPRWDWVLSYNEEGIPLMTFKFSNEEDSTQFKLAWF